MNTIHESCVKVCNSLLRGELSAVETYAQAIRKYPDSPVADQLREIRNDHIESSQLLADHVLEMGGEPETDSGAWGVFAKSVQGAANLFGANSAIESLIQGEEMGRSDYEDALRDEDVLPESKAMMRDTLLPPVVRHISRLHSLEEVV
jgi:uncharacterized protein (TIGR02284 family)